MNDNNISLHDQVKLQIAKICSSLGFEAKEEYGGKGWRADVLVSANDKKYAFEVQITKQSLKATLKRQEKYIRDGVIGCWLFEKEPAKQKDERPNLPLFAIKNTDGNIYISLKERKVLPLDVFISDFLKNRIKFCSTMVIRSKQKIEIAFVEMDCWKCGKKNYIYYIISNFSTPCNSKIYPGEELWVSDKLIFKPDITNCVKEYAKSDMGKNLNLAVIKERYSKTVNKKYPSFGCSECDSIFGDWFVHEAKIDTIYGEGIVDKIECDIELGVDRKLNIPHWCHPGNEQFCE